LFLHAAKKDDSEDDEVLIQKLLVKNREIDSILNNFYREYSKHIIFQDNGCLIEK